MPVDVEYESLGGERKSMTCERLQAKTDEIMECQGPSGFNRDTFRKRDILDISPQHQRDVFVRTGVDSPRVDRCNQIKKAEGGRYACDQTSGSVKLFAIDSVESVK